MKCCNNDKDESTFVQMKIITLNPRYADGNYMALCMCVVCFLGFFFAVGFFVFDFFVISFFVAVFLGEGG